MNEEKLLPIIENIKSKEFKIYFFTMDTKGNPKYSIIQTYDIVKELCNLGYDAMILHEKEEYHQNTPIGWMGDEYNDVKHISIEKDKLTIKPEDFVIVPEVFANVMEQLKQNNVPSKNIVLCQSPEYIFEILKIGKTWSVYDFNDVITTSKTLSTYVKDLFPSTKTYEIPVGINDMFSDNKKLKKPIITVLCRNQNDILKIVKTFHLKHPIYNWFNFRDVRGLTNEEVKDLLQNSFLAVWVDDISGFGTFPIEAFKCNTPIIGKIPNTIPEWMVTEKDGKKEIKENGIWVSSVDDIPNIVAEFCKLWLQDELPERLFEEMEKTAKEYTKDELKLKTKKVFEEIIDSRIKELEELLKQK